MKIFITGYPGIGKSTILQKTISNLRKRGCSVGGVSTPEVTRDGRRIGFDVVDVYTGNRGCLARIGEESKHRIGRYGVCVDEFESVAVPALEYAEQNCDLIAIDEIGPMELLSISFKTKIDQILASPKPLLSVLHRNYIERYGRKGRLIYINKENRDELPSILSSHIMVGLG